MSADKTNGVVPVSDCDDSVNGMNPSTIFNRPGLNSLSYRIGTHGSFLDAMKHRISFPKLGEQSDLSSNPLIEQLTTRNQNDAGIALLDAWATVADVLTFYQERIANEGYLRTATEPRSIFELANLVGYKPRPGVASSVYLAYTVDANQKEPVEIPAGARVQSTPGPGELPQVFETSEPLIARAEWNNLQVQTTQPQIIGLSDDHQSINTDTVYFKGVSTNLKTNDLLLFDFQEKNIQVLYFVKTVEAEYTEDRTKVVLQKNAIKEQPKEKSVTQVNSSKKETECSTRPLNTDSLATSDNTVESTKSRDKFNPQSALSSIVTSLLSQSKLETALSTDLNLDLKTVFGKDSNNITKLITVANPLISDSLNQAWENAVFDIPKVPKIYAFRVKASPFGASAPLEPIKNESGLITGYQEWSLQPSTQEKQDEFIRRIDLDAQYDSIVEDSLTVVIRENWLRTISRISRVQQFSKADYGITGKSTRLMLEKPWLNNSDLNLSDIRGVIIYAQSEELALSEMPCEPVLIGASKNEIPLQQFYQGLEAGRLIMVSGELADIKSSVDGRVVEGISNSEIFVLKSIKQSVGSKARTTLVLAGELKRSYKRNKMSLFANVVPSSHGETRNEIVGSGDGNKSSQMFVLKQSPLTFVPSSISTSGTKSTLKVYVNGLEWKEVDNLAGLDGRDRKFVTRTDDKEKTSVIFGNGKQGSRLPFGLENVIATYRNGIGKIGNVKAGQINQLLTRPLGIKDVTNPRPASGGADKDSHDLIRINAPLGLMALDRLVSVQDYADFSRTFAGIGKASAQKLSDGSRTILHVTVAGIDDIPITEDSGLHKSLLNALRQFGDPDLPVKVDARELIVLILKAKICLVSGYLWLPVEATIRAALFDSLGFNKRSLGQPALRSEIIALIQSVPGVEYINVDAFYGAAYESILKNAKPDNSEQNDLLSILQELLLPESADTNKTKVCADLAQLGVGGMVRPAQLAVFNSGIPQSIILNQIGGQ